MTKWGSFWCGRKRTILEPKTNHSWYDNGLFLILQRTIIHNPLLHRRTSRSPPISLSTLDFLHSIKTQSHTTLHLSSSKTRQKENFHNKLPCQITIRLRWNVFVHSPHTTKHFQLCSAHDKTFSPMFRTCQNTAPPTPWRYLDALYISAYLRYVLLG